MVLKIYHPNLGTGQLMENNMIKVSNHLLKSITRLSYIALTIILIATPSQAASEQRKDIERTPFYDKNAELICGPSSTTPTAGGGGLTAGGSVYYLGDSIGEGVKVSLEKNLATAGYKVVVNADASRSIAGPGQNTHTSGLEAATADAETIKGSQAVIIELGTNSENNFQDKLNTLINQIKATGTQAKIYLVDVAASPSDATRIGAAATNKVIYAKATELGTPVISRFKIYYPGGNPETYENATNPSMPFDKQGVHSTTSQGYEALSGVIQTTITTASALATPSSASPCQCPVSGGTGGSVDATVNLSGNDNMEKAFNFFISKGFTPQQSGGILGNLQAESGVNPKRVQNTGTPEGDKDNITVNNHTGYGIAQWTSSGRQQGLVDLARSRGMTIEGDLALQLDYLMQELTVNYKGVYDALKLSSDLRSASDVFMTKFERPKDQSESAKQKRAGMGQKILELYGDGSGAGTSLISGTTSCNSAAGGMSAGFVGFPLQTTKARMTELNGGQFSNGVMKFSGHPYAAHDINADPGTPVVAVISGQVVKVGNDKCGGRMLSVWSEQQGVTVAYLHLSVEQTIVKEGEPIAEGQVIGFVGPPGAGCGTPHLHIDANTTNRRIGCKRESCSAENKALFQAGSDKIGLPKALFDSYQRLP